MQQVQFFAFGLLVIWLLSTGKLRALYGALTNPPPAASSSSYPPTGVIATSGVVTIPDPNNPNGPPLRVYG